MLFVLRYGAERLTAEKSIKSFVVIMLIITGQVFFPAFPFSFQDLLFFLILYEFEKEQMKGVIFGEFSPLVALSRYLFRFVDDVFLLLSISLFLLGFVSWS